ncbi:hypothetical protein IWX90DRAFT_23728 [Phyllosticta citrichinensis]|uniref:Uncharacterized protein n=1 Tax=Phyllosticta citrichinensis TaxID=1130410 RepID=A0ABR1Y6S6_9PEZI
MQVSVTRGICSRDKGAGDQSELQGPYQSSPSCTSSPQSRKTGADGCVLSKTPEPQDHGQGPRARTCRPILLHRAEWHDGKNGKGTRRDLQILHRNDHAHVESDRTMRPPAHGASSTADPTYVHDQNQVWRRFAAGLAQFSCVTHLDVSLSQFFRCLPTPWSFLGKPQSDVGSCYGLIQRRLRVGLFSGVAEPHAASDAIRPNGMTVEHC